MNAFILWEASKTPGEPCQLQAEKTRTSLLPKYPAKIRIGVKMIRHKRY